MIVKMQETILFLTLKLIKVYFFFHFVGLKKFHQMQKHILKIYVIFKVISEKMDFFL